MTENQPKRRLDGWLIVGVLAVAAGLFLLLRLRPAAGMAVEVAVDGVVTATFPLDTPVTWEIPGVGGGSNTLVIADGQASVIHATCPDGVCVRTGAILRTGQSIVCLPNRVVVTVIGGTPALDGEV